MLAFGHTGITLGAAALITSALERYRLPKTTENEALEPSSHYSQVVPNRKASWLTSLGSRIDIRLLLVGSLLPDIIDKPTGQLFFRETFGNGRIFSHTLIFLLLITLAGFYVYLTHGKTWLFVLSFGTFTHLICDQMWLAPQTLLWPAYGWAFPKYDPTYWLQNIFYALYTDPALYVPELVGAVILVWFVLALVHRKKFYSFIKNGQVL